MGSLSTGGGTSAVAASTHAGCARFRHTDPMVVGISRREIAKQLGAPDTSAGIPEARWMRAMTFERLVHNERFVSELLTTAVGRLDLPRPKAVRRVDAKVSVAETAKALSLAHTKAIADDVATMITSLAVPFVGMEDDAKATPVKPDFAIVVRRPNTADGTWLIMGDAKDYERVRSRIDDPRMLKGFLQVALGATSAAAWSALPAAMSVHRSGALAVPRNAFLQPEAVVECLDDHCLEVRARADERTELLAAHGGSGIAADTLATFVAHVEATFDPRTCTSCALFNYCRSELRSSLDAKTLLTEIGIRAEVRPAVIGIVDGVTPLGRAPESVMAAVRATVTGRPVWAPRLRTDPVGLPGTIDVVLAKADAAALGVHGLGIRSHPRRGTAEGWKYLTFADPQSPTTRLAIMRELGEAIDTALGEALHASAKDPDPVHLVVPDMVTGDVLVSIADSLAGIETSRLRWARDLEMGRPALTFNGEPAVVPAALTEHERLGVSFLLEEDRSRGMECRSPIVDLRAVLARHLVPGGPTGDAGRLDYLAAWGDATSTLDHRAVSDSIAAGVHTPGARLSNNMSDQIHQARPPGDKAKPRAGADPRRYRSLVEAELAYKAAIIERAAGVLASIAPSRLREAHRALEADAQAVWRKRLAWHANDLVRFGRTGWVWRNNQVDMRATDAKCASKLAALACVQTARDLAIDAGAREVAFATVVDVAPLRLTVQSRRIGDGSSLVLLHRNDVPVVEHDAITLKTQQGSFKFGGVSVGPLEGDERTVRDTTLLWDPKVVPELTVGDELIVADAAWFGTFRSGTEIAIDRPSNDTSSSPRKNCTESTHLEDPGNHQYCCRPHEVAEAEWADKLAARRERGELNPQAWPPVIDEDEFDTAATGSATAATEAIAVAGAVPPDLTLDNLD